jgi:hydrogenase maturation protease
MANNILILGVGNTLRRDDGVGPIIIELLKENKKAGVDYLDGGIDGLALIDVIRCYKRAIIIDAVDMRTVPGTVKLFTPQEAKIKIKTDALSTHGFGLAEVITLMEELGYKADLQIIGIQPQDISFGEGLTDIVQAKLKDIIKVINNLL